MLTATLGGLIKDYRIKKRLSQLEVSLRIGWKDTSRLSKIEQGRVGKPTRETAEKIIKALDLNMQEKGELLLMGGYLPTAQEIKKILKVLVPQVDNWSYPAYVMDFSWRLLYSNDLNLKVLTLPLSVKDFIEKEYPNVLLFAFLPKEQFPAEVEKGEDKNHLKPFQIAQIAAFKTETHQFQNEGWYNKLVQDLMKFEKFRELWSKIDQKDYHKKLYDYEYKKINSVYEGKKRSFEFHIFTAKIIYDPRFQLVLYFPANKETDRYWEKFKR
ncbi:helix-turn-helix domain-containing protein [Candidatus Daviesbacteria bacterium]|nr:helix-turn-helix domain-containing protein [Candidatus Daviesbacteria bacterium]